MATGKITISTAQPKGIPPKADFAIYVNFDKDAPNPQRIFQAVGDLISAFQKFDKILCQTIDSNIEPVMMLEEVEIGSLKIWLRNVLQATDDADLKKLDWKPTVGKYLVKAKYLAIEFLNSGIDENKKERIEDFGKKLASIASDTDVRHLPDYKAPLIGDLATSLREISDAKGSLSGKDSISYISDDKEVDFNLTINWTPEKFDEFLTKEKIKYSPAIMILAIKKPDYLGNSQWELRHGKIPIKATIKDENWLKKFQCREVDVRPRDSLRCMVEQEYHYGYDNELISQLYIITEVLEVLENSYYQRDMFHLLGDGEKK